RNTGVHGAGAARPRPGRRARRSVQPVPGADRGLARRPATVGRTATSLAASGVVAPWPAIARGLAVRPADRHPTLAPLIAALDGDRARPRRRTVLIAGAAAMLAAAAGIVLAVRGGDRDPAAACGLRHPMA